MKYFLLVFLLFCSLASFGQTNVTATVVDPNGNPYGPGTASAYTLTATGSPFQTIAPVPTSIVGYFTMSIPANTYIFTVCAAPTPLGPPSGNVPTANPTPQQICFSSQPVTISGTSQDISNSLNASAKVLGPRQAQPSSTNGNAISTYAVANCPSGTILNQGVIFSTNGNQVCATNAPANATNVQGICVQPPGQTNPCGNSGVAQIQASGFPVGRFDNTPVLNDFVTVSATPGLFHDFGPTIPGTSGIQVVGTVAGTGNPGTAIPICWACVQQTNASGGSGIVNSAPQFACPAYLLSGAAVSGNTKCTLDANGNVVLASLTTNGPGNGSVSALVLNNVMMADRFPGATADVQIMAAIAALPSSGGTVDARGFGSTSQTIAATVAVGGATKPVRLLLGPGTFTCTITNNTPCWTVANGSRISGDSNQATDLTASAGASISSVLTNADHTGSQEWFNVDHLAVVGGTAATTISDAVMPLYSIFFNSSLDNISVFAKGHIGLKITNVGTAGFGPVPCIDCWLNGEAITGSQPLVITSINNGGLMQFEMRGGGVEHEGTGQCLITINGTTGGHGPNGPFRFTNMYTEGSFAGDNGMCVTDALVDIGSWYAGGVPGVNQITNSKSAEISSAIRTSGTVLGQYSHTLQDNVTAGQATINTPLATYQTQITGAQQSALIDNLVVQGAFGYTGTNPVAIGGTVTAPGYAGTLDDVALGAKIQDTTRKFHTGIAFGVPYACFNRNQFGGTLDAAELAWCFRTTTSTNVNFDVWNAANSFVGTPMSFTSAGTGIFSGQLNAAEQAPPSGQASIDLLWGDSTAHRLKMNNNNGGAVQVVGSGADINTSDQVTAAHPVNLLFNGTAPTILTHFNTSGDSITQPNGTAAFEITEGTGTGTSTGAVTLPTATNGWNCFATNKNRAALILETGDTTTSATFTNFGTTFAATNWTNSDVLYVSCFAR